MTDNSFLPEKIKVRKWIMKTIPDQSVLDLYCGKDGLMWSYVWKNADSYFGVDKNVPHSKARTVRMSAEKAVSKLDLDKYNIFDIGTYSSPWVVARRILKKKSAGIFGLALTCGESRGMKNGKSNEIIRVSTGSSGLSDYRLLYRYYDLVIKLMIRSLGEINNITIEKAVMAQAGVQNKMTYIGLIVLKNPSVGTV